MVNTEKIFKDYLENKGMRLTRERRLILNEITLCNDHFDVGDLVHRLRFRGEKVSTTSVYRTIPLLIGAGIIIKNSCDKIQGRLEPVLGREHNDHLVCLKCKKIVELRDDKIEKLQEKVAKKYGFKMDGHRLIIRGYCADCNIKRNI